MTEVKIIRTKFFSLRPWYVLDNKTNQPLQDLGFKTKKAAVGVVKNIIGVEITNG